MSGVRPTAEISEAHPVPVLLVELPSRHRIFFGNLRDLFSPPSFTPLELCSAPAPFWSDVFVKRSLPWDGFFQSIGYHMIALGLLLGLSRMVALQRRVLPQPAFDHSEVVYYQRSEKLPALDTRSDSSSPVMKADPEFSSQPIISVPPHADNHAQTIVTPSKIKLQHNFAMPNIVAWSDKPQKPKFDIPPAPLTPAAEITRIAPQLDRAVVKPPPDSARLAHRRNSLVLQNSVVAPPPDVGDTRRTMSPGLDPALIAPPPTLENSSIRALGDLKIAPSAVIAPAPRLPLTAQRALSGGSAPERVAPQIVPPPPSTAPAGFGASFGSQGRVIALSLHPVVNGPSDSAAGNRRGSFATTPDGHAGASGAPGSNGTNNAALSSSDTGKASGASSARKGSGDLPSGLYVGKTGTETAPVAGTAMNSSANTVNPNLIASVRPPRVSNTQRAMQPENIARLSEPERAVFGNRRFYSLTLNMPNLNSAGGSWVVRFAEAAHNSDDHHAASENERSADLTQPMPTRKVDPAYPLQIMRENVAGTVILYAVIHADGTVGSVRVLRGVDDRLDRFASDALAQWKFEPATKNGTPVDVEATFQIPFRPSHIGTSF